MKKQFDILAISGSLRQASYNTALLRAAADIAPENMNLEIYDLADIPLYNADVEARGLPEPVARFKDRIARADALLISTPEYNYSIPGVLKNALDWASRYPSDSPLNDKPMAILGAGGRGGTMRAQMHLRQVALHNGMPVLPKPEVYVMRPWEKFDQTGELTHARTRERLRQLLEALAQWVSKFHPLREGPKHPAEAVH